MNATAARVRPLPAHLVDQIKAGEVVERPANVLKELLENALDAGATRVELEIRDNGLALLRVSDDGRGIHPDDLELAFSRHATSKIERFDDLYRLDSFGFRGEALPSIASVSRLECASWTATEADGASIRFEGGVHEGTHRTGKSGPQHGTTITVRDLFYNTPVRLKFLQSPTAEKNWVKRFLYAFILSRPDVSFHVQWEDEEKRLYPAVGKGAHADRALQLFSGRAAGMVRIRENAREWDGLRLKVLWVEDHGHRAEGPLEHVLVNGRPLLDKALPRVAQQVFERHGDGSVPRLLILLDAPPGEVDVNVHPNKTSLKFHRHGEVLSFLTATLREMLSLPTGPALPLGEPTTLQPKSFSPSPDLSGNRGENYATHLGELLGELPGLGHGDAVPPIPRHGPYFLCGEGPESLCYVDGRRLLALWFNKRRASPAEPLPLLVSHPLRGWAPDAPLLADREQSGFEMDELEPGFWVLRAIPAWLKGVPLECVDALLRGRAPETFDYGALSPGKWAEALAAFTPEELSRERVAVPLTPALFKG